MVENHKVKLTVCRVLCCCNDFDSNRNLTRTRLWHQWHVCEAKCDPPVLRASTAVHANGVLSDYLVADAELQVVPITIGN
jgi:hypothetical protein